MEERKQHFECIEHRRQISCFAVTEISSGAACDSSRRASDRTHALSSSSSQRADTGLGSPSLESTSAAQRTHGNPVVHAGHAFDDSLLESNATATTPDAARRPPHWLDGVVDTVRERFRENVTLAELGELAGVHSAHVGRTFRRYYGKSPGDVARELRVRRVCERLADRTRSLAELAFEAGFADQAHMTRTFVRLVGVTPGKLRAVLR